MEETKRLQNLTIIWEYSYPKERKSTEAELDYLGCKGNNCHLPPVTAEGISHFQRKMEHSQTCKGAHRWNKGSLHLRMYKASILTKNAAPGKFLQWYFFSIYSISMLFLFIENEGKEKWTKQWLALNPLEPLLCPWNAVLALHNSSNSERCYAGTLFPLLG